MPIPPHCSAWGQGFVRHRALAEPPAVWRVHASYLTYQQFTWDLWLLAVSSNPRMQVTFFSSSFFFTVLFVISRCISISFALSYRYLFLLTLSLPFCHSSSFVLGFPLYFLFFVFSLFSSSLHFREQFITSLDAFLLHSGGSIFESRPEHHVTWVLTVFLRQIRPKSLRFTFKINI